MSSDSSYQVSKSSSSSSDEDTEFIKSETTPELEPIESLISSFETEEVLSEELDEDSVQNGLQFQQQFLQQLYNYYQLNNQNGLNHLHFLVPWEVMMHYKESQDEQDKQIGDNLENLWAWYEQLDQITSDKLLMDVNNERVLTESNYDVEPKRFGIVVFNPQNVNLNYDVQQSITRQIHKIENRQLKQQWIRDGKIGQFIPKYYDE